jgi:hypothetical protein
MSDGRKTEARADGVKFMVLIAAFIAASAMMALRLPA